MLFRSSRARAKDAAAPMSRRRRLNVTRARGTRSARALWAQGLCGTTAELTLAFTSLSVQLWCLSRGCDKDLRLITVRGCVAALSGRVQCSSEGV